MMITARILSFAIGAALLASVPAFAQSSAVPTTRIGVGVALTNSASDSSLPIASFEVPIDITRHLRVQPEFGYQRQNDTESDSATLAGRTMSYSTDETISNTWFGASVLYTARPDRFGWYAGGKGGLLRSTLDEHASGAGVSSISESVTADGYFAGAVLGGEYFLHDRFSLGVVINLMYQSIDVTLPISVTTPATITEAQHRLETKAAFTARVYFR
jgi:hypothetical protein